MKKKDLGILRTGLEFITLDIIETLDQMQQEFSQIAMGIFSDEMFLKLFGRKPIKSYSERVRLASALKGVDFVFEVNDDTNLKALPPIYTPSTEPKEYHIAYVPGTFDLLHEGHLQHLLMCRDMCDILVVGVNSDKLVWGNKGKRTQMSENDRLEIVHNLTFVDYVYLVETNDKSVANSWVKAHVGAPIDVILMGSDLKGNKNEDNPDNIPIVFTERDPKFQETNSSSYWRKRFKELNTNE